MGANYLYYLYQYWYDEQDPRTKHFPIIRLNPWLWVSLMALYLLLVNKILVEFMRKRKPYSLKKVMLAYNIFMMTVNVCFFSMALYYFEHYFGKRIWDFVMPSKLDVSPNTLWEINVCYLYYLTKLLELIETFVFVLRKKQSQVTFLHCYHHTAVALFGYMIIRIQLVHGVVVFGLLNTFIHTLMYAYYTLSTFGDRFRRYLWWKRYITIMQLIQFIVYCAYIAILLVKQEGYPIAWIYFGLTQPPVFFYMFYKYYIKSYLKEIHVNDNNVNNNNNNNKMLKLS